MSTTLVVLRSHDQESITNRIIDRLSAALGLSQLQIIDDSSPVDSVENLTATIAANFIILVLISPRWLNVRNERGQRLIDDPADIVHIMIDEGIRQGKLVIPVLIAGAEMVTAAELSPTLAPLALRTPASIRPDPDFAGDVDRLAAAMKQRIPVAALRGPVNRLLRRTTIVIGILLAVILFFNFAISRFAPNFLASLYSIVRAIPTATALPIGGAGDGQTTPIPTATPSSLVYQGLDTIRGVGFTTDGTEGWAVGVDSMYKGVILHYQNGTWQQYLASSVPATTLNAVTVLSHDEAWASGNSGTLLHYTQGTWLPVSSTSLPLAQMQGLAMISPTDGWAVGGYANVVIGGQKQDTPTQLWHYTNGSWVAYPNNYNFILQSVVMLPAKQEGWAAGQDIFRDNDGNISGGNGHILHFLNGTWTEVVLPANTSRLFAISMSPTGNDGWAAGEKGTLLHYSQGTWKLDGSTENTLYHGIRYLSANDVWAVGYSGFIVHYDGTSWKQITSSFSEDLLTITMLSSTNGWICGKNGTILHYLNGQWIKGN